MRKKKRRGWDPDLDGGGHPLHKARVEGSIQEYKDAKEFEQGLALAEGVHVGPGPWIYRKWEGVATALVPVQAPTEKLSVYVGEVDWSLVPPAGELACLFHSLFKKYDREVLVIVGRSRSEDKHVYFVPEQVGTGGGVTWKADEDIDEFHKIARWVGTIHIHPGGMSAEASGVDVEEWAEPKKSGLHLIFGRDGGYTVYLAVEGRTILVGSGTVSGTPSTPVTLWTSRGRPVKELLLEPKSTRVLPETRIPHHYGRDWGKEEEWDFSGWEAEQEVRFPERDREIHGCVYDEVDTLVENGVAAWCAEDERVVFLDVDGLGCIMPREEYQELRETLGAACPRAYYVGRAKTEREVR